MLLVPWTGSRTVRDSKGKPETVFLAAFSGKARGEVEASLPPKVARGVLHPAEGCESADIDRSLFVTKE